MNNMIKKIVFLLLLVVGLVSCEEKEVFLYPNFSESATFNIKTDGFEYGATIDASAISDEVNDAVEDEGSIDRVVLEGLWFEVTENSGNTADKLTIDLKIKENGSDEYLYILKGYEFEIKNGKVVFLDKLVPEGVLALKNQINDIALGMSSGDVAFKAVGETTPEGSEVDVKVEVFVNATVVYTTDVGM